MVVMDHSPIHNDGTVYFARAMSAECECAVFGGYVTHNKRHLSGVTDVTLFPDCQLCTEIQAEFEYSFLTRRCCAVYVVFNLEVVLSVPYWGLFKVESGWVF